MRWPSWPFCLFGSTSPVAFDIHLKDGGVMDESVDGGQCHCRVWEDCVPFPEGLVGGDEHRSSLVSRADEFEQNACFSLVLGNVIPKGAVSDSFVLSGIPLAALI